MEHENTVMPLARARLDRLQLARTDATVAGALAASSTRVLLVSAGQVAVGEHGLDYASPAELDWLHLPTSAWIVLGAHDEVMYLALDLPTYGAELMEFTSARRWANLREIGDGLDALDVGAATEALALIAWHQRNPRCPLCGELTEQVQAGWVRRCPAEGTEHYPRLDPAIIVTVTDAADRLLLAHGAQWPAGRYSLVAGFVEPGESVEAAVCREVAEETGIQVDHVQYVASQPWPFPASLMLGMRARAGAGQIAVDGVEVTAARWVGRAELTAALASGEITIPAGSSIARAMITDWYGAPLP